MNQKIIYLDYNSTTPVHNEVLEAMLPYFSEKFGNAASKTHVFGWQADEAVELGRERIAKLINCEKQEIIFTSGSTEAINIAIKGVYETYASKGNHIVTVKTEHKAVLDTCAYLEKKGAQVTYLPVNADGLIDLSELEKSITNRTILVCIMYANNETGVLQPIQQIAKIVHEKNCILFSDATQALGKIFVDVQKDGIDVMCLSAHKLYGPKGVGVLYIRRKSPRVTLLPLIHGGGHERSLRSGTLNVPGIVGLGKACDLAFSFLQKNEEIQILRDYFEEQLLKIKNVVINCKNIKRLPNTTNVIFKDIKADSLIMKMNTVAFSVGSACTSAIREPSHVLKTMGLNDKDIYSAVRFSIGLPTTKSEIDEVVRIVNKVLSEK